MENHDQIVQRWRDLRKMLIAQLEMFESGALTLKMDQTDISSHAIADLKKSIDNFDTLIAGEESDAAESGRA